MIDQYGGRLEPALAAYNAGKSRADAWSSWGSFREPAEFIETIPFTETRNYVQIVLRNAELYRRLYAAEAPRR
jgi:soluble lytic murein transglycosylase